MVTSLMYCVLLSQLTPRPEDIVQAALNQRRQIKQGKLVVRCKPLANNNPDKIVERDLYFWLDGNRLRVDQAVASSPNSPAFRTVTCNNCDKSGYVFVYTEQKSTSGRNLTAQFHRRDRYQPYAGALFEPRLIGYIPTYTNLLYRFHLESALDRTDRQPPTLRSETHNGALYHVVGFRVRQKNSKDERSEYEYWIDPSKGNSIGRAIFRSKSAESVFVEEIESKLARYKDTAIWFPASCLYTRTNNGTPAGGESLTIEQVSFNEPLPESAFTLAGMKLPEGYDVLAPDEKGMPRAYTYQAGKLVPKTIMPDIPKPPSGMDRRAAMFWAAGIGMVVLSLLLLRIYVRNRATA